MARRKTKHMLRAIRAKGGLECAVNYRSLTDAFTLPRLASDFDEMPEHQKLRELARHLRFTPRYT